MTAEITQECSSKPLSFFFCTTATTMHLTVVCTQRANPSHMHSAGQNCAGATAAKVDCSLSRLPCSTERLGTGG